MKGILFFVCCFSNIFASQPSDKCAAAIAYYNVEVQRCKEIASDLQETCFINRRAEMLKSCRSEKKRTPKK